MFLAEIYANKWVKLFLVLLASALGVLLIIRLNAVLSALMISLLLAYLCDPIADFFEKLKLSRIASVAVVALLILLLLFLLTFLVIPMFVRELGELASGLPAAFDRLKGSLLPQVTELLARFNVQIPATFEESLDAAKQYAPTLKKFSQSVWQPVVSGVSGLFTGIVGSVVGLLNLIIIPVAWFYLLKDFDVIKEKLASLLPGKYKKPVVGYARRVDEVIQNFLQGQIIVALILGVIYGVGLQFIAKVPLGFMLGMMAGLVSIVPYMGLIIGIAPALLLAFLAHGDWQHPLYVVLVFVVAQLLEGNLITPKIVGDKVGLHPVTIIFALLIFGELFGLLGLLIAVPVTAVLMVFLQEGISHYMESAFFKADA